MGRLSHCVLILTLDESRNDINLLDLPVSKDKYGNTNIITTPLSRDIFLNRNGLTLEKVYSEQLEDDIHYVLKGDTVYGQYWDSTEEKEAWLNRNSDAW